MMRTVGSEGEIFLPGSALERAELAPGDEVTFVLKTGHIEVHKATSGAIRQRDVEISQEQHEDDG